MSEIARLVYNDDDFLCHYQVKGAKHGVRRWQYPDGSLTPEGRIHYGVGPAREKKDLSEESKRDTERLQSLRSKSDISRSISDEAKTKHHALKRGFFEGPFHYERRYQKSLDNLTALQRTAFDDAVALRNAETEIKKKYAEYSILADEIMDAAQYMHNQASEKDLASMMERYDELAKTAEWYLGNSNISGEDFEKAKNEQVAINTALSSAIIPKDPKRVCDKMSDNIAKGIPLNGIKELDAIDVTPLKDILLKNLKKEKNRGSGNGVIPDDAFYAIGHITDKVSETVLKDVGRKIYPEYRYGENANAVLGVYLHEKAEAKALEELGDVDGLGYAWSHSMYYDPHEEWYNAEQREKKKKS